MRRKKLNPIHPGEVLQEEFLKPLEISQKQLSADTGVSYKRINQIVQRKRSVTADVALRLARYFKVSPEFWLGLQMDYDLDMADDSLTDRVEKEVSAYSMVA
jgi:addiction module HigA family antidote